MNAQERALQKMEHGIRLGDMRLVEEAHAILANTLSRRRTLPEPFRLPEGVAHMIRPAPENAA